MPSVKCSECGFENRADARFCKGCGHVLPAPPASQVASMSLGVVCLACGYTTTKPGARFCLRCGEPLPTTVLTDGATASSFVSPPPAPPAEPERRGWLWGWIGVGGGAGALVCTAVLGIAAVFVVPRLIDKSEEPAVGWTVVADEPSLTPVTPTVGAEPTATPSPTLLPTSTSISSVTESPTPTATPTPIPTSTPTSTSPPPTDTPSPESVLPEAVVGIALSDDSLAVGDLLTVTVTIANTGEVGFGKVRCRLVGEWSLQLEVVEKPDVVILGEFGPGEKRSTIFVLRAVNPGVARIQAGITMEAVGSPSPAVGEALSDDPEVVVLE